MSAEAFARMQITQVFGIDFSGAVRAGRKIWIAEAMVEADSLRITTCSRACDLAGSGRDRALSLAALREFIGRSGNYAYGLDFPFGLPRALVEHANWEVFVLNFGMQFKSAVAFSELTHRKAGSKELKRVTDIDAKTPFSPYNLRLFRQTFYGIRDVLAPLVAEDRIRVLPMQIPAFGRPAVIEICPASTLKSLGLMESYKKANLCLARERILDAIGQQLAISIPDDVRRQVVEDRDGDVLDSVVAAAATHRALQRLGNQSDRSDSSLLEGFVYV